MEAQRTKSIGMPTWVKLFIGIGIIALIVVGVMVLGGHGPGQHAGMTGTQ